MNAYRRFNLVAKPCHPWVLTDQFEHTDQAGDVCVGLPLPEIMESFEINLLKIAFRRQRNF